jgi:hypothetical protein
MSACDIIPCPNHACNFVATRSSTTSTPQCGTGWHFASGCTPSRESARIDMNIMYYIRSQTTVLYQMAAICLSDNCNNFTTFTQLKDAITVDPDLSCLIDDINSTTSTVSTTSSSTTAVTSTVSTTSTSTTTTTLSSSVDYIFLNNKLFILIIFFNIYK